MTTGFRYLGWALVALLVSGAGSLARAQSAGGEGIGVHGYWIIEVRNPDGTLVSHTEFENDLQTEGKVALVKMLQGGAVFSYFYIELASSVSQPCLFFSAFTQPSPCYIAPPGSNSVGGTTHADTNTFRNLAATPQTAPTGALVLSGAATASRTGQIDLVRTRAASACGLGAVPCDQFVSGSTFTAFSLEPDPSRPGIQPIPVTVGQVVQVTVRLSFTAASHP